MGEKSNMGGKIKEDKERVRRIYGRLDEREVKWEPYVLFK